MVGHRGILLASAVVSAVVALFVCLLVRRSTPVEGEAAPREGQLRDLERRIQHLEEALAAERARAAQPKLAVAPPVRQLPPGPVGSMEGQMDTPAGMEGQKADAPTKPDAVTIVDYATALAASTRSWTSEEVTDTYKRMVGPLVSYLEPPVTENQVQQILQNMKDGEGSKWLAFQALRDKYERRLSEADYKQMVWDESVAYNAMSAYIKRYILSAEQARWFPYGRRYHEQK